MVTPGARRTAVVHLRENHAVSERRACRVIGADRSSMRYRSVRPPDVALRRRLRALSTERRRFGYRRLHILLAREGWRINHKKLRRLYREEGLQARQPQARRWHKSAPDAAIGAQSTLVTGFRLRCLQRWPPVPYFDDCR